MSPFLTVNEAAKLTGKSPSSIRRVIYPIIHDDAHADRGHIQPTVDEVVQLRLKGENFAWRLSEELLRREVPVDTEADRSTASATRHSAHSDTPLIEMLRAELQIKNQQITQQSELIGKQMELISGLSERLREGNVLIGTLQQRMALTDGRTAAPSIKVKRTTSTKPEKGSSMPPKTKPKRSFLSRFFG